MKKLMFIILMISAIYPATSSADVIDLHFKTNWDMNVLNTAFMNAGLSTENIDDLMYSISDFVEAEEAVRGIPVEFSIQEIVKLCKTEFGADAKRLCGPIIRTVAEAALAFSSASDKDLENISKGIVTKVEIDGGSVVIDSNNVLGAEQILEAEQKGEDIPEEKCKKFGGFVRFIRIAAKVAGCVCSVCSANVPAAIETGRGVFQEIQGFSAERKICAGKRSKQITIKELEDVVGVAKTSFKEVRGAFVKENDVPPPSDIGDVGIGL